MNPGQVLLIEAGGDETEISDVPALAAYLQVLLHHFTISPFHHPTISLFHHFTIPPSHP